MPRLRPEAFRRGRRRFAHLLHQFLASATDLDGRFWRTMRALLFQPGLLSREYFEGRRARWISPVSLFLAISVVYFIAPIRGGDLTLEFNQQVSRQVREQAVGPDEKLGDAPFTSNGPWHSRYTSHWIDARVRRRDAAARSASNGAIGYSYRDYRIAYDARANDVSKALVVLHAPIAALALMLMFARQRRYFAEHFVFALHYLAFWMVALQVILQVSNLISLLPTSWHPPDAAYDWTMRMLLPGYAVLALRRAYETGWLKAMASAAGLVGAIVVFNLYVYHAIQFVVTFVVT